VVLGEFYSITGRAREAEDPFQHALEIDPKSATALGDLAALYVFQGGSATAEQVYGRLATLPDAQYKPVHAFFLLEIGQSDEAVRKRETSRKQAPALRSWRTHLIGAYLKTGRVAQAEKMLADALKQNPQDTETLLQSSAISLARGELEKAVAGLHQVLTAVPDSAETLYLFGQGVPRPRGAGQLPSGDGSGGAAETGISRCENRATLFRRGPALPSQEPASLT